MTASENFNKLVQLVDDAQNDLKTATSKDQAQLRAKLDEARKSADERAAAMRAKTKTDAGQSEDHWHDVQSNWDQHVQQMRARIDEKKAQHDAKVAEREAEAAEIDAREAVDFAASAIEEAEYAVLDASLARVEADAVAAA